jgi:small subunit ribosomal protein S1
MSQPTEHPPVSAPAPNTQAPAAQPAPSAPSLSAELEAEIDAAMAAMDAADAGARKQRAEQRPAAPQVVPPGGARPAALRGPRVVQAGREHRTGKVVTVGPTDVFVEFGPKELGIVPRIQWGENDTLPVAGEELTVVVDKFEAAESIFLCSRPGSVQKADWELLEPGQVVEARVTGVAGKEGKQVGLDLELAGHRAFMPAGQIGFDRVEDLSVFVGEKLKCKVQRVERAGRGNIVLSRREVLAEERKALAEEIKKKLTEGDVVDGIVRKVMPFGAFVDIGGVDGLVHLSDLTYDRVGFGEKAVEKFVKEGQQVKVKILKLDWEGERISLGIKQVQGDPFANATNTLAEGAEVTGKVVSIVEFGAFVELAPGVQGLVHISELDHKRVMRVEDVLKKDEIVTAKILKIDPGSRRVSLSIKAMKPLPEVTIGGKPGAGGKDKRPAGRSAEEILKETPALRRLREKFKNSNFKGGLS